MLTGSTSRCPSCLPLRRKGSSWRSSAPFFFCFFFGGSCARSCRVPRIWWHIYSHMIRQHPLAAAAFLSAAASGARFISARITRCTVTRAPGSRDMCRSIRAYTHRSAHTHIYIQRRACMNHSHCQSVSFSDIYVLDCTNKTADVYSMYAHTHCFCTHLISVVMTTRESRQVVGTRTEDVRVR